MTISLAQTMTFDAGTSAFAFFAAVLGLLTTVFWMIVAWRAMRAHERLADAAENGSFGRER